MGDELAAAMMSHLPPVGWADVATKHDLHELERRMDLRFSHLESRFVTKDDFERGMRQHLFTLGGMQTAMFGILLVIARL